MLSHALITLAADQPTTVTQTTAAPVAVGVGGVVFGIALGAYVFAKWPHSNKEARKMFILGVVIASLLGFSGGMFGMLGNAVRQTGNSVGDSITQTTTGR